jgi:hypothetical protein
MTGLIEAIVFESKVAVISISTPSGIQYHISGRDTGDLKSSYEAIGLKTAYTQNGFSIFERDITTKNETITDSLKEELAAAAKLNLPGTAVEESRAELAVTDQLKR